VPFYCGGLAEWPQLRKEIAELRNPAMEMEQGQVKQVLEEKDALASRLKRSPDLLDALLMTFTFLSGACSAPILTSTRDRDGALHAPYGWPATVRRAC
jgi:hypothetical protein